MVFFIHLQFDSPELMILLRASVCSTKCACLQYAYDDVSLHDHVKSYFTILSMYLYCVVSIRELSILCDLTCISTS